MTYYENVQTDHWWCYSHHKHSIAKSRGNSMSGRDTFYADQTKRYTMEQKYFLPFYKNKEDYFSWVKNFGLNKPQTGGSVSRADEQIDRPTLTFRNQIRTYEKRNPKKTTDYTGFRASESTRPVRVKGTSLLSIAPPAGHTQTEFSLETAWSPSVVLETTPSSKTAHLVPD